MIKLISVSFLQVLIFLLHRKKDGKTHVFDETFKENDSEASDITVLEERLQALPIKDDEDQDSFQDPEYDDADRDDDSSSETSTERNTDRSETVDRREFLHNAALPSCKLFSLNFIDQSIRE